MKSTILTTARHDNTTIEVNFGGGTISEIGGVTLAVEFLDAIGFPEIVYDVMGTDKAPGAKYSDADLVLQILPRYMAGFIRDIDANRLRNDPVLTAIASTDTLGSQSTVSRFWNSMNEERLQQLHEIWRRTRRIIYAMYPPKVLEIDLDTTLIHTYGKQEGALFNGHYQDVGLHPFVASDVRTRDLLGVELRPGSMYCSKGAAEYLRTLISELLEDAPDVQIRVHADSGFASPDVYEVLESFNVDGGKPRVLYAIKLKDNPVLEGIPFGVDEQLLKNLDYTREHEHYGEFQYQAGSWDKERRVAFRACRPKGQFLIDHQFIVSNMPYADAPVELFEFYRQRGDSENCIKTLKEDFALSLPHKGMKANEARFTLQAFACVLLNWMRRICLPKKMRHASASSIRRNMFRIGMRVTRSGRKTYFRLSSTFAYKDEYWKTMENIRRINEYSA